MSYNSISFLPTLSNSLFSNRFNQIDKIFSTLTGEKPLSELPDYDFIKFDNTKYQLILVVPGYHEHQLDVSIENNQLTISGNIKNNKENQNQNLKYIHKGINNNSFSISFNLYHPIKINKAILKLGLLKINFEYEIPESKKIKKINIEKK
ncbi:Hsp20 family protein [Buchnera aphidicola]|uniref:Heat-shock protein n=1 Tax=Buchnera aphidicola (Therioaphis trifolii) TaxID=1241884 RepID=A0A4D6YDP5_9GAMM|nr:Hsp20 family protein [Buchnera aphidicola]QCI27369.1 heat-shock protein [Buchnera aphidicola (Therioaphis trifolii)]